METPHRWTPGMVAEALQQKMEELAPQYGLSQRMAWQDLPDKHKKLLGGVMNALFDQVMTDGSNEQIWVASMVAQKSERGLVQLQWGGKSALMGPMEAKQLAVQLFECAEAAKSDEMAWAMLRNLGMDTMPLPNFLQSMRQRRKEWAARFAKEKEDVNQKTEDGTRV